MLVASLQLLMTCCQERVYEAGRTLMKTTTTRVSKPSFKDTVKQVIQQYDPDLAVDDNDLDAIAEGVCWTCMLMALTSLVL
jgi:hypothetical protein